MSHLSCRVVVVGGGPVGLAFAIAAAGIRALRVSVLERGVFPAQLSSPEPDHRVYALSPSSMDFLRSLGVIAEIPAARLSPIQRMRVFGDCEPSNGDTALPETMLSHPAPLATVIEHSVLMAALHRVLGVHSQVEVREHVQIDEIVVPSALRAAAERGDFTLHTSSGLVQADLLVGADGRGSRVRTALGIEVLEHDYQSDAIVANFSCESEHGGCAFQWFSADGVLAFLPLPGKQISIVWSVPHARTLALMSQDDAQFAGSVSAAANERLGKLSLISRRDAVPLRRQRAQDWVASGAVLIGDAAHAIHPLAGQGMNLGFGDAQCLARMISERGALRRPSDLALLRAYQRERIEPTLAMSVLTDRLYWLFRSEAGWAKSTRRHGISTFDRLGLAKSAAIDYAMRH